MTKPTADADMVLVPKKPPEHFYDKMREDYGYGMKTATEFWEIVVNSSEDDQ